MFVAGSAALIVQKMIPTHPPFIISSFFGGLVPQAVGWSVEGAPGLSGLECWGCPLRQRQKVAERTGKIEGVPRP